MELQTLLAPFRRAVNQFSLIDNGDKIAVGVSGGKDSLVLLALLNAYRRFSPQRFELAAVTVDMGFEDRKSTRLNSSHSGQSRMPSSA